MPDTLTLSRAEVREVDRRAIEEYGLPGIVLMENAGRNTVDLLDNRGDVLTHVPVVIVCGKGNNAGDGFVIARHLENRGFDVQVLLAAPAPPLTPPWKGGANDFAPPFQGGVRGGVSDAAIMYRVIECAGTSIRDLSSATEDEWIAAIHERGTPLLFDALLGTGLTGTVREPFDRVIAAINASEALVVAVDIPSGLDCDQGQPLGCAVKAGVTVTFVGRKRGFDVPGAKDYTGDVIVADIGVPVQLLRSMFYAD